VPVFEVLDCEEPGIVVSVETVLVGWMLVDWVSEGRVFDDWVSSDSASVLEIPVDVALPGFDRALELNSEQAVNDRKTNNIMVKIAICLIIFFILILYFYTSFASLVI